MALNPQHPSIYPTLRYGDARAAVRFLTEAFGFSEELIVDGEGDTIVHGLLGWGNGVVMVSSRADAPGPFDTGRCVLYLAVDDPDAHHRRAVAAGAEILMPLTDQDYGSREYAAQDPEGNVWCFGTCQPGVSAGVGSH